MLLTIPGTKRSGLALSPEEAEREMESGADVEKLIRTKKFPRERRCIPTSTANAIRYREGRPRSHGRPLRRNARAVGGYTIIEAKDLDEAIFFAIASGVSCGRARSLDRGETDRDLS